MAKRPGGRRRTPRDPLQVNLRRVVYLILLLVIVPTVLLTGFGIVVMFQYRDAAPGLILGILVTAFSASVVAGATLLLVLARRGARLAEIQETFLSRMSHELLTPIAGIRLHSQILQGLPLEGETRASVDAIVHETSRLSELVERIVGWRRFRSTRHLYQRAPVSIATVLEAALRRLPAGTAVRVRAADPRTFVNADAEALAEALGNLVLNAVKYAGQDGPIDVGARRIERMAAFTVSDRGPGLPPVPVEQVFEPFFRHVPTDRPDPGGSGLGLSIARQIVRAHGGKLAVAKRRGRGLHFYIVLPLVSAP